MSKTKRNTVVDSEKPWKMVKKSANKRAFKKQTNRNIRHAAKESCEVVIIDHSATRAAWNARAEWCRQKAIELLKECSYWQKMARNLKDQEIIIDDCVLSKQRFYMD